MDPLRPGDPGKVGSYRILGRLGAGGMGQVFLGASPGGRRVAVKLIHPGQASVAEFRQRFAREIEAARRVGGFHTASVVDADPDADPPWMVTAYIPGPSLQAAVAEHGPLPIAKARALGAGLAEGLAAIHACGLVHRDLKPSNVILADDGPRIIDFGIARAVEASSMTTAGAVVGTFCYMSPEQIQGERAGPASDVFSLGCTLAFAATARPPFGSESIPTVMHRILSEPPDLEGLTEEHQFRPLIAACMAKSAADRPTVPEILASLAEADVPAAEPLAAEAGSPVIMRADPGPGPGRTTSPSERQGTMTVGSDGGTPRETAGLGPSGGEARPEPGAAPPARTPGRRLDPRVLIAGVVVIGLLAAVLSILLTRGAPAAVHLSSPRPASSSPRPASSSPHPATSSPAPTSPPPAQPAITLGDPGSKGVYFAAFSPDGASLAAADANGSSYLFNVATGQLTATLTDPGSTGISQIAFSPDGASLAAADGNGSTYLWDVATRTISASFVNPDSGGVYGVAFSPDGRSLAAPDGNGHTYIWDVATGSLTATCTDPGSKGVYDVAFSPDGKSLAAADGNGNSYLCNVATGQITATLHDPDSAGVSEVAFSPDGKSVAAADDNGSTYVFSVATGKVIATFTDPGNTSVYTVVFGQNGKFLATGDVNGNVNLWDVATGGLLATLADPGSKGVYHVMFSPDGRSLAAADDNGRTYLWDMSWLGS